VELVVHEVQRSGHAGGQSDPARVGIDADDRAAGVRLPEIRRKEAEAATDVEDAPLVRQEQVHHAEELGPKDREPNLGVGALDERERTRDAADRLSPIELGRLEGARGAGHAIAHQPAQGERRARCGRRGGRGAVHWMTSTVTLS